MTRARETRPRRKPKFKVGQVVYADGVFLQVEEIHIQDNGEVHYDLGTLMNWTEKDFRALTLRERGQR